MEPCLYILCSLRLLWLEIVDAVLLVAAVAASVSLLLAVAVVVVVEAIYSLFAVVVEVSTLRRRGGDAPTEAPTDRTIVHSRRTKDGAVTRLFYIFHILGSGEDSRVTLQQTANSNSDTHVCVRVCLCECVCVCVRVRVSYSQ